MARPISDPFLAPLIRLRGRRVAGLWFLAAVIAVLADHGPTGAAGTLIHVLLVVPTSAAAAAVLALWMYSRWTVRRRR